ncbi:MULTISPECIES: GmrSD restriction endonuclease domain-containing protein [Nocardiaceae]|uniref:GmrSD restriction endonuclease domain-containing protein n=1 Tax=Nocardiaceae TaxID=85025 RepID=UPI0002AD0257|nr:MULTISPECIES: DUF1524 domain-containing protein [Rhodococcus]MDJ0470956.1 excalibur calcium-binding domain-containing protein [Rhodococcus fascians]CCQ13388.1 putative uncharacterized protein [Rhodococcus sp. AW25M09]
MSDLEYPPTAPHVPKGRRKLPWVTGAVLSVLLIVGCVDQTGTTDSAAQAAVVTSATTTGTSIVSTSSYAPPAAASSDPTTPGPTLDNTDTVTAALRMLATLPIKGRAPKTGYDRDMFGQAWTDDVDVDGGRNGCDTRNDLLRRDLIDITLKPGSNGCTVQSGTLADVYTAASISFVRGSDTSSDVQIDHIVALSNAWQTGAQQLDQATRANFANDPRNLQAVDGPANQQKSDGDAATWLPSNKAYRCTYVARQVAVKAAYGLWVTPPEHDAIVRVLRDCGATAAVETAAPSPVPASAAPAPKPAPAPNPAPSDVVYKNCNEVRAAGAAPIRTGEPGFSTRFDGDGDGVGCE